MAALQTNQKLYDVVLVVELQQGEGGKNAPFISYRYPSLFEQDPFTASVTQFCFPDMNHFPTDHMENEAFSFVLTEGDGERRFGYCLRRLPLGKGPRYPIAYSIMTYFPCLPLYTKILQEVAIRYENYSMKDLTTFVDSVLQHRFPAPGETFEIKVLDQATRFTRPDDSDSQLEHLEVGDILTELDDRNIVLIFVSLLLERRVIFCSSKLSTLSSCIQAAVALLYPLTWQHIYIPVLPRSLLSFVCAPMPFVVGVLRTELDEVLSLPMDEVLVIDIDNNHFIRTPTDNETQDLELLPPNYSSHLRRTVRNVTKTVKKLTKKRRNKSMDDLAIKQLEYEMRVVKEELTSTFIQFFVTILSGYREFLKGGSIDREAFIAAHSPDLQPFLTSLTDSQMFECFLNERATGMADTGFEKRIDQIQRMGEKLSQMGIGKDLDAIVPQFGVDKKRPSTLVKKSKLGSGWSTLRNQFKVPPPGDEQSFSIGAPTLVSSSTEKRVESPAISDHSAPQFVLPKPPARTGRPVDDSVLTRSAPHSIGILDDPLDQPMRGVSPTKRSGHMGQSQFNSLRPSANTTAASNVWASRGARVSPSRGSVSSAGRGRVRPLQQSAGTGATVASPPTTPTPPRAGTVSSGRPLPSIEGRTRATASATQMTSSRGPASDPNLLSPLRKRSESSRTPVGQIEPNGSKPSPSARPMPTPPGSAPASGGESPRTVPRALPRPTGSPDRTARVTMRDRERKLTPPLRGGAPPRGVSTRGPSPNGGLHL